MAMRDGGNPRVMLIGPERLFYAGLLGRPTTRNLGGIGIYVAPEGRIADTWNVHVRKPRREIEGLGRTRLAGGTSQYL